MVAYFKSKTKQFIESKNMYAVLVIASFLESIIVPIPLEAVLIPLMQAKREKIWLLATLATVGCIFGAVIGYGVGYFLFDQFAEQIASWFSDPQQLENVKTQMQQQGFWYVLSIGIIPVPFQIAMLAAGAVKYPIGMFLLATLIARSLRYFGLALLVKLAGNHAEALFRKYKLPTAIGLTILVAVIWWIKH
ncbi:VTT domain-containing protein [Paraglaciecola mesophila]|jgi:membrane protein YqaA with SNARE-associated domain|uniref:DedA family protein BAL199 n=2 Tax=Paraglaciecola mesophila TaxID=197222 RepID=K6Z381_9ALTE|nr:VTT domain-containing protein [Paraglaciecola mesophila]GAC23458.1 DedA family protein BAL199 [Paraglaciecola mesophila KMM 241]|tara:strand:- start:1781 stop:2353 length:573 start_codon:yes stop_codon:yes gene_type:complete